MRTWRRISQEDIRFPATSNWAGRGLFPIWWSLLVLPWRAPKRYGLLHCCAGRLWLQIICSWHPCETIPHYCRLSYWLASFAAWLVSCYTPVACFSPPFHFWQLLELLDAWFVFQSKSSAFHCRVLFLSFLFPFLFFLENTSYFV